MSSTADPPSETPFRQPGTAPVQAGAIFVGVVFVLLGLVGFVPGVTQHWNELRFAGPKSGAEIVDLFRTSIVSNALHLATGVIGFVCTARGPLTARNYLFGAAFVYFALFAYGLLVPRDTAANFMPVDDAANFLNLVLAAVSIISGILLNRTSSKITTVAQLPQ